MEPIVSCQQCNNWFVPNPWNDKLQTARVSEPVAWLNNNEPIPPFETTEVQILPCPRCRTVNVIYWSWLDHPSASSEKPEPRVIWPRQSTKVPSELPEEFHQDYREAWDVLEISPRSSAVLGRRLLERVLEVKFDCKNGSLKMNIKKVIDDPKADLTSALRENLDVIRNTGNFAGHQQKDKNSKQLLDINDAEAKFTLQLVTELIDHVYVRPAQMRQYRKQFEEKVNRTHHSIQTPASEKQDV